MFIAAKLVSSRGCNSVSIQTVDSDVSILALYYAPMVSKSLYIKIRATKKKNERTLNVTEVTSEKYFLRALPGLNTFSGCERVHFTELKKESG